MLKDSLATHRMKDLREIDFDSEEYRKLQEISFQAYDELLKKFIPEEIQFEFGNALFEYELTVINAEFEYVKKAYRQGIKDGFELSKILN